MIGMKDQCFGVEVEMTGLTRRQAAQALANYFGTEPYYVGGGYDKWSVKDPDGKVWSITTMFYNLGMKRCLRLFSVSSTG